MITVGLTGGIGSGKTSVSDLFERLGTPVIDTDVISRELVNHSQAVQQEIIETLGQNVASGDGSIDRKKLAHMIFTNVTAKQKLEKILHPKIRSKINNQLQQLSAQSDAPDYAIIVIPLLFETDFRDFIDRILVVSADESRRIERIKKRDGRDISEIHAIINNQVSDQIRINGADDVIENNGDLGELSHQVHELHHMYRKMHRSLQENS